MRHFDSREAYADALDALLEGTDPIAAESAHVQEVLAELDEIDPEDADVAGLLGEIANQTLVAWYGKPGLHTLGSVEPALEIGWCPLSVLTGSPTRTEDVCPDRELSPSDAAYYVLVADLEAALDRRLR